MSEIPEEYHSFIPKLQKINSIIEISLTTVQCIRCGQISKKKQVVLDNDRKIYYCPHCIQLGRIDSSKCLYYQSIPVREKRKNTSFDLSWHGELTNAQQKVSKDLINSVNNQQDYLVWAVTGAGKTEMLFQMIQKYLQKKYTIGLVSPRIDVCLELYPRFQKAFLNSKLELLYGNQTNPYYYTPFIISTVHQLLRFYHFFDIIIIDEADAFPFYNNPILYYAVREALSCSGIMILLTATLSTELRQLITQKKVNYSILAKRFHGHSLVVPTCFYIAKNQKTIWKKKIPNILLCKLKQQFQDQKATLLFCPDIRLMEILEGLLKKVFPEKRIASVSSKSTTREAIVQAMRDNNLDLLLCTTILERGVTFNGIDVFVYNSDHIAYTSSVLIQISGRVGRSYLCPTGRVYFFYNQYTKAMKHTIQEINWLNQQGDIAENGMPTL